MLMCRVHFFFAVSKKNVLDDIMNTGETNALGRSILRGPRGGLYVLVNGQRRHPAKGRKPGIVRETNQRNGLGRTVFIGPRGGKFVMVGDKKRRVASGRGWRAKQTAAAAAMPAGSWESFLRSLRPPGKAASPGRGKIGVPATVREDLKELKSAMPIKKRYYDDYEYAMLINETEGIIADLRSAPAPVGPTFRSLYSKWRTFDDSSSNTYTNDTKAIEFLRKEVSPAVDRLLKETVAL
jgi:hypothetical protein